MNKVELYDHFNELIETIEMIEDTSKITNTELEELLIDYVDYDLNEISHHKVL